MNKFAITSFFADFARDEEGAQIIEYALIVALVSVVLIGFLATVDISGWAGKVNDLLDFTYTPPAAPAE